MPSSVKLRLSLTQSLPLLLVTVVVATQIGAYLSTANLLADMVRERELDKATNVSGRIDGLIRDDAVQLQSFTKLLGANTALASAVRTGEAAREAVAAIAEPAFRDARLASLRVVNTREQILYRATSPHSNDAFASDWGTTEALQGDSVLTSRLSDDCVEIRAIEPLRSGGRVVGAVAAGMALDQSFFDNLAETLGAKLVLASRSGPLLASQGSDRNALDASAVTDAFEKKIPIYRHDAQTRKTAVYLPVLIVDDGYLVVVQMDSAAAYTQLQNSVQRSALIAVILLVIGLFTGTLMLRYLLRPLRELRTRAQATALQATGSTIPSANESEIPAVVEALDQLTRRLLARNEELELARRAADSANRAKSAFVANMSHEVRTLLNGVLGMVELLKGTALDEKQRRYCDVIATSGNALLGVLGDVLDFAKIESGKMELERVDFDLHDLIVETARAHGELAAARRNRFEISIGENLRGRFTGDPSRLRQILNNLLGNAVKFTEGGTIGLAVSRLGDSSADKVSVEFVIADTGIGIPADMQAQLFRPFVQGDSSLTRTYGGSGLGLVICKHLLGLMGGVIHCESAVGKGTRMRFTLRLSVAAADVTPVNEVVDRAPAGTRLLLAEDHPVNREVIRDLLAREGIEVTVAVNGEEAVKIAREEHFDAVLMDCHMPVMDGFEATRRIRAEENNRRIPIIALTANVLPGIRQTCLEAGMDDYLPKPSSVADIQRMLHKWLNGPNSRTTADAGAISSPAAETNNLEPFNRKVFDGFIAAYGNNAIKNLTRIYLESTDGQLSKLRGHANASDLAAFTGETHSLKSASASLGGTSLAALCARAEALGKANDAGAFLLLERIESAAETFCAYLKNHPCMAAEDAPAARAA